MSGTLTQFTPGDIVVSETGDVGGATGIGDNQASPITLVEIDPTKAMGSNVVGTLTLPQSTTASGNTTEYPISGEFGSSSEGSLELSGDGKSLVIAGYAVNYATYNTGGAAVYGNAALAQSTSIQGGSYTAVARVVADITGNATIDTSTALYNIFDEQNPRSVATVNGTSFYLSGQGDKGSTNQGVFLAQDGSNTYTALNTGTDARTVEIYNGQLYVSIDSKQANGGTVDTVGTGLPTSAATYTALPGIGPTVTLNGSNGNALNGSSGSKYISPENYFFANASTLYIADGGSPKEGGVGDGGLQKWSLVSGTWTLDYTLSSGLGLVANTAGAASLGDTGLIGLTGAVNTSTGAVTLYATTVPLNDLGSTGLYTVTDTLSDTTAAQASGESFTELLAGVTGSVNVRGVAFAPTPACFVRGTRILTDRGEVPVEALSIGDRVVTLDGTAEPIRWIGRRAYAGRALAGRQHLLPILFRAGSLGPACPARDLRVSAMHAMYLDGLLIAARHLTNAATIRRDDTCEAVEYVHLEFAAHQVIWAEGAATESYLEDDNRWMFSNAGEYEALYPQSPAPGRACARLVEQGAELQAVRARLRPVTA